MGAFPSVVEFDTPDIKEASYRAYHKKQQIKEEKKRMKEQKKSKGKILNVNT